MEGLCIDPRRQVVDRASGPVHGPALLDALGSLVTHDEVSDILVLSHASVKVRWTTSVSNPVRLSWIYAGIPGHKFQLHQVSDVSRRRTVCTYAAGPAFHVLYYRLPPGESTVWWS